MKCHEPQRRDSILSRLRDWEGPTPVTCAITFLAVIITENIIYERMRRFHGQAPAAS